MEYGTKSWAIDFVTHHPNQSVHTIYTPTNPARGRYGCELLQQTSSLQHAADRALLDQLPISKPEPKEPTWETQWDAIGCALDGIDTTFTQARNAFSKAAGGDEKALHYLVPRIKRGEIKYARGFIMSWFKDNGGANGLS